METSFLCGNAHTNVRFHCFETTFLYQSIKHMHQTIAADDACWSITSPPLHPSIDSCDRKRITSQQGRHSDRESHHDSTFLHVSNQNYSIVTRHDTRVICEYKLVYSSKISEILNTFITPREHHRAPLLALLVRTYSALSLTKDALSTYTLSAASAAASAAVFGACCLCCCLCPSVLLVPDSATDWIRAAV